MKPRNELDRLQVLRRPSGHISRLKQTSADLCKANTKYERCVAIRARKTSCLTYSRVLTVIHLSRCMKVDTGHFVGFLLIVYLLGALVSCSPVQSHEIGGQEDVLAGVEFVVWIIVDSFDQE